MTDTPAPYLTVAFLTALALLVVGLLMPARVEEATEAG